MPTSALDNESFGTPTSLHTFLKLACVSKGVVISPLGYYDVRRLVHIDGEDVAAKDDDILGEALVDACVEELQMEERIGNTVISVEPLQSIATLFEVGEAKQLKPRCVLAQHTHSDTSLHICGILVACSFSADDSLSTSKFSPSYCAQHGLPRLDARTMLIDVVSTSGDPQGVGTMLVLACYLAACRSRNYERVCVIAITTKGKKLFGDLGWRRHNFREGTPRSLFWIDTGELKASALKARLRWDESVQSACWRAGATSRNVPDDSVAVAFLPEVCARSCVFVAEDVRREWQFVSSTLAGLAHAIEECCRQTISLTSLAESARHELRKGYTGGFRVTRLSREDAVVHFNTTRGQFKQRALCAKGVGGAWRFREGESDDT